MDLSAGPTVLVVDDDPGFLFWLGELLSKAGSDVVPALNCGQALSFVSEFKLRMDLIVLNPALAGVSEMMLALHRENGYFMVAVIRNGVSDGQSAMDADYTLERPSASEPIEGLEWLAQMQAILHDVQLRGQK